MESINDECHRVQCFVGDPGDRHFRRVIDLYWITPRSGHRYGRSAGPVLARSGSRAISFDQFVGRNENGLRHGQPHRLCGPRIDH
jgi:hypothetical protein